MTRAMPRRDLFGLGAGLGLAACAAPPPPLPPDAATTRWLDVHCHVFNAADLPMFEFAQQSILPEKAAFLADIPLTLAVVALLTGGLNRDAVSAAAEMDSLEHGTALVQRQLPGAFELALRPPPGLAPPWQGLVPDPLFGLHALRERARLPGPARPRAALNGFRELPHGPDLGALLDRALRDNRQRTAPGGLPSDPELELLAARIRNNNLLLNFVAWGQLLTLPRGEIIDRLLARHGGGEVMLTPALVDYDLWLGAEDNKQAEQVRLMGLIARQRAAAGQAVHAFMAFDPWRALKAIQAGEDFLAPFAEAILRRGDAIGVKLYPPMGFRPSGNAGAGEDYPPALTTLLQMPALPGPWQAAWQGFGGDPAKGLDFVLDQLFAWCCEPDNDVPVMAHCGDTLGAAKDYSHRANPAHWRAVLERHRTLRLNLGHFGGAWDLGAGEHSASGFAWTRTIAAMLAEQGGRAFPNLYVDVAFFAEVLPALGAPQPEELARAAQELAGLRERSAGVLDKRLMYGSDWNMTGFLPRTEEYAAATMAVLAREWRDPEAQEDLRWRNACRFLGLGRQGRTAQRLEEKVYAGLPAPVLARLRRFRVD